MEMELEFLDNQSPPSRPKATIHITGKLGFNREGIKKIGLDKDTESYFRVAKEKNQEEATVVYLVPATEGDQGAIKAAKAGEYFYLNIANVFDSLKLDYKKYSISFDIEEANYNGTSIFVLKKRTKQTTRMTA